MERSATAPESTRSAPPAVRAERFLRRRWPLLLVMALAFVLRAAIILEAEPTCPYPQTDWEPAAFDLQERLDRLNNPPEGCWQVGGDAIYYYGQGRMVADGKGYGQPFQYLLFERYLPSAAHPPAYTTALAAANVIGLDTVTQQRLVTALIGAVGVGLLGLLAERLGGRRAGVLAAGIAAVHPLLWVNDVRLMSESIYVPVIALVLLAAYRLWAEPTLRSAGLLGVAIGVAQLTRSEAGALAVVLVVPLVLGLRPRRPRKETVKLIAVAFVATQLVVMPWVVRNLRSFEEPVLASTGTGTVLLGGACDDAFTNGEVLGLYNYSCYTAEDRAFLFAGADPSTARDESQYDAYFRDRAVTYLREHLDRLPVVVAARLGRMWELYRPMQNAEVNDTIEGRGALASTGGLFVYVALWPATIAGLVALRRRRLPISPFVAMAVMVSIVAVIISITRYRVPVDASMAVLAGVGVDAVLRWQRARQRGPARFGDLPPDEPGVLRRGARSRPPVDPAERASRPGPVGALHRAWGPRTTALLVVLAAALGLRILMVLVVHPTCEVDLSGWRSGEITLAQFAESQASTPADCFALGGDAQYIFLQAEMLARGDGFSSPLVYAFRGELSPGAGKPIAYVVLSAGLHAVGIDTPTGIRLVTTLVGVAGVWALGEAARRIAGRRAGLVAAGIAAGYPMLFINDWKMMNDSMVPLAVAAILIASDALWRRPRPSTAAVLGVTIGSATFVRNEMGLLLVLLVPPLVWSLRALRPQARAKLGALVVLCGAAVILPWSLYNLARFDQPTFSATGTGSVLLNGSCDQAWSGDNLGWLDFTCFDAETLDEAVTMLSTPGVDESDLDRRYRERALEYIGDNASRAPAVMAARVGRMWDVYRPISNVRLNIYTEHRGWIDSWWGFSMYVALLPLGVYGAVLLRRRGQPISPFVAMAVAVSAIAAISFGLTRYRSPVDAALCVLAAIAIDHLWSRRPRRRPPVRRAAPLPPSTAPAPVEVPV